MPYIMFSKRTQMVTAVTELAWRELAELRVCRERGTGEHRGQTNGIHRDK